MCQGKGEFLQLFELKTDFKALPWSVFNLTHYTTKTAEIPERKFQPLYSEGRLLFQRSWLP